jgi:hypothetical protein
VTEGFASGVQSGSIFSFGEGFELGSIVSIGEGVETRTYGARSSCHFDIHVSRPAPITCENPVTTPL